MRIAKLLLVGGAATALAAACGGSSSNGGGTGNDAGSNSSSGGSGSGSGSSGGSSSGSGGGTSSGFDASILADSGFLMQSCSSKSDCTGSDVCCSGFMMGGSGPGGFSIVISCMASCSGTGAFQLCASADECPSGDECMTSPLGMGSICVAPRGDAGPRPRRDGGEPQDDGGGTSNDSGTAGD
jgi:hypothetical protein